MGIDPPREYREGEEVQLNVQFGEGLLCAAERDLRTGRVVHVSQRAIVVADLGNPAGGFSDEQFRSLAATFDSQIWPVIAQHFGEPHDIDRNQRVVLFFTRAVNELAPPGQRWYVGGVFAARDLFPPQNTRRLRGCAGSNYGELIYLPVPDPLGEINGNERSTSSELLVTPGLMAHELQHVVNASRRLYGGRANPADWNEEIWLNEGLSHVAEELTAYATSDLGPRRNLGIEEFIASQPLQQAFVRYLQPNFQWLAHYLENPDTTSLYGRDSRATRGATWQFLRYAADRRGRAEAQLWRGLVDSSTRGLENLGAALGADPLDWIHDWLVSIYTDDHVPSVHPRFTQPSWKYRNLYPNLRTIDGGSYGRYPLRTRTLTEGTPLQLNIAAGSAAYVRFGVAPNARGEIRSATIGASCREGGPARTLGVGEVAMLIGAEREIVCVEGGAAGAEFVYVPFHAAATGTRSLTVRGSGIVPVSGAAGTVVAEGVGPLHTLAEDGDAHRGWELRFREQEARELGALVPGAGGAAVSYNAAAAGEGSVRVAIVRTR